MLDGEPFEIEAAAFEGGEKDRICLDREAASREGADVRRVRVAVKPRWAPIDLRHGLHAAGPGLARPKHELENGLGSHERRLALARFEHDEKTSPEVPSFVGETDGTRAGNALDAEARRRRAILDLKQIGKISVDLKREAQGHRLAQERRDGHVVVERAEHATPKPAMNRSLFQVAAGHSDRLVLHVPLGGRGPRTRAGEHAPGVACDRESVRAKDAGISREKAVQLLGSKLSVPSAGQAHAASVQNLQRMRDAAGHRGT
jgi:hypothetical protein